jgi:hypothetical protein
MQSAQPVSSPLAMVLFLAAIAAFLSSPKKLRTLGRMALGFVVAALLIMIPTSIARKGDPEMWGRMAAEIGIVIAAAAGWWDVRALRRAAKEAAGRPPTENGRP